MISLEGSILQLGSSETTRGESKPSGSESSPGRGTFAASKSALPRLILGALESSEEPEDADKGRLKATGSASASAKTSSYSDSLSSVASNESSPTTSSASAIGDATASAYDLGGDP